MNKLAITGRLANVPQMKFFESGKCLCTFSIGVNQGQEQGSDSLLASPVFLEASTTATNSDSWR